MIKENDRAIEQQGKKQGIDKAMDESYTYPITLRPPFGLVLGTSVVR
jgi:hypothetical protein